MSKIILSVAFDTKRNVVVKISTILVVYISPIVCIFISRPTMLTIIGATFMLSNPTVKTAIRYIVSFPLLIVLTLSDYLKMFVFAAVTTVFSVKSNFAFIGLERLIAKDTIYKSISFSQVGISTRNGAKSFGKPSFTITSLALGVVIKRLSAALTLFTQTLHNTIITPLKETSL